MALKNYRVGSLTFQYEEGEQPVGAVEVKAEAPKARTARNKAAKPASKGE